MSKRLELHQKLVEVLGSTNVYFQPPSTVKMTYPAIVYSRSALDMRHANNDIYHAKQRYTVTVIDKNPDSGILRKMLRLKYSSFDRHFVTDNLNHDVYTIYY